MYAWLPVKKILISELILGVGPDVGSFALLLLFMLS